MFKESEKPQEEVPRKVVDVIFGFQQEIANLKETEKKKGTTVHLSDMDPSYLTEEDWRIRDAFKKGTLEKEDFEAYRNAIESGLLDGAGAGKEAITSRMHFAAYIANMWQY